MVVVVDTSPKDDHRPAFGINGVLGELATDPNRCIGGNPGVGFLPRGCRNRVDVVVACGPLTGDSLALHAVLRKEDVVDGGDKVAVNLHGRHTALDDARPRRHLFGCGRKVEAGKKDLYALGSRDFICGKVGVHAFHLQVPLAHALCAKVVGRGTTRVDDATLFVPHQGAERSVFRVDQVWSRSALGSSEELPRDIRPVLLLKFDQEGGVGELCHVVQEERLLALHVELFEDDVPHGHG